MSEVVKQYLEARNNVQKYFNCPDDYFIKAMQNFTWKVHGDEGIYFLTYWDEKETKVDAVVVKKDNKPLIYKTEDYTMVIALDCIKIAFILKNENENK